MHPNHLGRVTDRHARISATQAIAFLFEQGFVADQDDLHIQFRHRLPRTFDARDWTMVTPYRIERDLHAS